MNTFEQLYNEVLAVNHPTGLPENLVVPFRKHIVRGLIHIQQYVDCFREDNTHIYPYCSTTWNCKLTVVGAPNGIVTALYTVRTSDWCARIDYEMVDYSKVLCEAKGAAKANSPRDREPVLQTPFKYPDPALDRSRRATYGLWARHKDRIYVSPYIHSSETIVVEYDGIKTIWDDRDLVSDDERFKTAIALFAQKEYQRDYEKDITAYQASTIEFQDVLRDLIHDCREKTRVRESELCHPSSVCQPCGASELGQVDEFDDAADESVFAVIGDFGEPTESDGIGIQGVADLVNSWTPDFIVTLGDNIYSPTDTYEVAVTPYYGAYITNDLKTNRFWPIIGNHDHSNPINGIADYYAFFTLPGNERYYELVRGTVHFFMLHSGISSLGQPSPEVDGVEVDSIQAEWLRARLATSNAAWKVVLVHDAPYSLGADYPGHSVLRWPYGDWGADVVLAGDTHRYERYEVDGLPYLVNGLGGATRINPNPDAGNLITPFLKSSYNADWGAIRAMASCTELKFEFITRTGLLIDTLTLTK